MKIKKHIFSVLNRTLFKREFKEFKDEARFEERADMEKYIDFKNNKDLNNKDTQIDAHKYKIHQLSAENKFLMDRVVGYQNLIQSLKDQDLVVNKDKSKNKVNDKVVQGVEYEVKVGLDKNLDKGSEKSSDSNKKIAFKEDEILGGEINISKPSSKKKEKSNERIM